MKTKQIINACIIFFLIFLAGRCSMKRYVAPDINVVTRADTVSIRETVTVEHPVYVDRMVTDTMLVAVRDTVIVKDTAYIVIEREQRHYRSMDYEAWVSGFRPALDSIRVFPETRYITKETVSHPPQNGGALECSLDMVSEWPVERSRAYRIWELVSAIIFCSGKDVVSDIFFIFTLK